MGSIQGSYAFSLTAPPDAVILVVEDDYDDRFALCDLLCKHGYEVMEADSAEMAHVAVSNQIPSLILCDILLDGESGYDLFKSFCQDDLLVCIPFLFISALSNPLMVRHGMHLGADDYITKPFEASDLLISVRRRILRQRKILGLDRDI